MAYDIQRPPILFIDGKMPRAGSHRSPASPGIFARGVGATFFRCGRKFENSAAMQVAALASGGS